MRIRTCAGYTLTTRRRASSAAVEHWDAEGQDGPAEVYLGPAMLVQRSVALPGWGPFPRVLTGSLGTRRFVVVPGKLEEDLLSLRQRLTPQGALALAWHLAAALAEYHEHGGAHGALHPAFVGIDGSGRLNIRPALASAVISDPDPSASAQATDCLQLATLFDALDIERLDDSGVALLMAGLRRERARLRLQPGRAARQALAALLARRPTAEADLTAALGGDWVLGPPPRMLTGPSTARPSWSRRDRTLGHTPWDKEPSSQPNAGPIIGSGPAAVSLGASASVSLRAQEPITAPPTKLKVATVRRTTTTAANAPSTPDQDAAPATAPAQPPARDATHDPASAQLPAASSSADATSAPRSPLPTTLQLQAPETELTPAANPDIRLAAASVTLTPRPAAHTRLMPPAPPTPALEDQTGELTSAALEPLTPTDEIDPVTDAPPAASLPASGFSDSAGPSHATAADPPDEIDVLAHDLPPDLSDDSLTHELDALSAALDATPDEIEDLSEEFEALALPVEHADAPQDADASSAPARFPAVAAAAAAAIAIVADEPDQGDGVDDDASAHADAPSAPGPVSDDDDVARDLNEQGNDEADDDDDATPAVDDAPDDGDQPEGGLPTSSAHQPVGRDPTLPSPSTIATAHARIGGAPMPAATPPPMRAPAPLPEPDEIVIDAPSAGLDALPADEFDDDQLDDDQLDHDADVNPPDDEEDDGDPITELPGRPLPLPGPSVVAHEDATPAATAATAPLPTPASAPIPVVTDQLPQSSTTSASANWSGATGITGDESREAELGAGKWTESARSLDEVRSQMTTAPVRELTVEPAGPQWGILAGAAVLVMSLAGWWMFAPDGDDAPATPPTAVEATTAPPTSAAPAGPQVTVDTVPPNSRVLLDDRTFGRAPAVVNVPTDGENHELCIEPADGPRACRTLTGEALALQDPYIFDTTK